MGATDLLARLRGAGLVLTLLPDDGLHVGPRSELTDEQRSEIRARRDDLIRALRDEAAQSLTRRVSVNPLMTPEEGDECHACGWDEDEITTYLAREERFIRMGKTGADAVHLAERLTLRDRQNDERRLCLECAALTDDGRCLIAARLRGVPPGSQPEPATLWRCKAFSLAPGLI